MPLAFRTEVSLELSPILQKAKAGGQSQSWAEGNSAEGKEIRHRGHEERSAPVAAIACGNMLSPSTAPCPALSLTCQCPTVTARVALCSDLKSAVKESRCPCISHRMACVISALFQLLSAPNFNETKCSAVLPLLFSCSHTQNDCWIQ